MAHGGSWKTKRIGAGFIFTNFHVTSRSHKITHHVTSRHITSHHVTSRHATSHHIIHIYIYIHMCMYMCMYMYNVLTNYRWFRLELRPINIAGAYTIYKWELNSCNEGNKIFGNPTTLTMLLSHGSPHPNTTALIMIEYASSQICLNRKPFTFLRIDICHKLFKVYVSTNVSHVSTMSINVWGKYVRPTQTTHMQVNMSGAISVCRKSFSQYVEMLQNGRRFASVYPIPPNIQHLQNGRKYV